MGHSQPARAAAGPVELKFGCGTTGTDALGLFDKGWMKQVEENSKGRVKMTWLGDAVIGPSSKTYDLLVAGTYDIGEAGTGNKPGVFDLYDVVQLPFIAPDIVTTSMAAQALADTDKDVMAQFKDLKLLFMGAKLASHIFTMKKPIRTVEDFKGMRVMVTANQHADIMKALGAVPVRMNNAEVYSALERGILDGALFHWNLAYGYKIGEIAKYVTMLEISRSCGFQAMNLKKWNSLPADIQKAIWDVSGYTGAAAVAKHYAASESDLMKGVTSSGKIEVIKLAQTEREKMVNVVHPLWDSWVKEMEAAGKPGKRVLDSFLKLQEKYAKSGK
jgi:TRAP-type C4-dicarboxylate transport system substrate-binding protein